MSYVFAGFPLETKPSSPRKDVVDGSNSVRSFQYQIYRTLGSVTQSNIALVVGNNVDRSKEQSIHSAFKRLIEYIRENVQVSITPVVNYEAYLFAIGLDDAKSQVELVRQVTNTKLLEADVNQDKLNVAFYFYNYTNSRYYTEGLFDKTADDLLSLAREQHYFCTPELVRALSPIADIPAPVEGDTVTISAPTWTGSTVTYAYWMKDGVVFDTSLSGLDPLVLTNMNVFDGGVYQVKAGVKKPNGTAPSQYLTSIGVPLYPVPTDHTVTVAMNVDPASNRFGFYGATVLSGATNDFGNILNPAVGGGVATPNGYSIKILAVHPTSTFCEIRLESNADFTKYKNIEALIAEQSFIFEGGHRPAQISAFKLESQILSDLIRKNVGQDLTFTIVGYVE
jgi:hypothetical protein